MGIFHEILLFTDDICYDIGIVNQLVFRILLMKPNSYVYSNKEHSINYYFLLIEYVKWAGNSSSVLDQYFAILFHILAINCKFLYSKIKDLQAFLPVQFISTYTQCPYQF